MVTTSTDIFGLIRRTARAARSMAGMSARSRSDPCIAAFFCDRLPYAFARRNESIRSRAGRLTYSATM